MESNLFGLVRCYNDLHLLLFSSHPILCLYMQSTGALAASGIGGGTSPTGTPGSLDPSSLGSANSILRVIIENMLYPITLDVLHQVQLCVFVCMCVLCRFVVCGVPGCLVL